MSETTPHLLLGVSGSIAAYRALDLVTELRRTGFEVRTILSPGASAFVTKEALTVMSQGSVYTDADRLTDTWRPTHVALSDWAHMAVVAPASAAAIHRLATGNTTGLLAETFTALDTNIPRFFAPAMNGRMLHNPAVSRNIDQLQADGYTKIDARPGELACGYVGDGKMALVQDICEVLGAARDVMPRVWPCQEDG